MIYQLNNETHWELSPELMRRLIALADREINSGNGWDMVGQEGMRIELSNFRSALECELYRLSSARRAALHERDARVYKAEGFPVDESGGLEL